MLGMQGSLWVCFYTVDGGGNRGSVCGRWGWRVRRVKCGLLMGVVNDADSSHFDITSNWLTDFRGWLQY